MMRGQSFSCFGLPGFCRQLSVGTIAVKVALLEVAVGSNPGKLAGRGQIVSPATITPHTKFKEEVTEPTNPQPEAADALPEFLSLPTTCAMYTGFCRPKYRRGCRRPATHALNEPRSLASADKRHRNRRSGGGYPFGVLNEDCLPEPQACTATQSNTEGVTRGPASTLLTQRCLFT